MLTQDYLNLYTASILTTDKGKLNELETVSRIIGNHEFIYKTLSRIVLIPWVLIAVIHFRESSLNFRKHLHNGDPLTDRTLNVPKGRPAEGQPPFTWIQSATDALKDTWKPETFDIPGSLEFLERYNGLGYRLHGVLSPYLWNYTDKYQTGLFVADGHFDPNKIEQRPGCVSIIKYLRDKGVSLGITEWAGSGCFH
jgi:lysozyme family protein